MDFFKKVKKFFFRFTKLGVGLLLFAGCTGLKKSEKEKLRDQNLKGEYIYRYHNEVMYPQAFPSLRKKEPYPWEEKEG